MDQYKYHSNIIPTDEYTSKEYSIQELADLAGVSTRTLRYYDGIGLLKPSRITPAGYRKYSTDEVDVLQLILFYKALDMRLEDIITIIRSPDFKRIPELTEHRKNLIRQRERLDQLIRTLDETLFNHERSIPMDDQKKFKGFIKKKIEENETLYGEELRTRFGNATVDEYNSRMMNMSEEDHSTLNALSNEVNTKFIAAFEAGGPEGPLAQEAAAIHAEWIRSHWGYYDPSAHAALAGMYVDDERFFAYYERLKPGITVFIRDSIYHYTSQIK